MKKLLFISLFFLSNLNSFAQKWEIVRPNSGHQCYQIQFEIHKKQREDDDKSYEFRITFQNILDVEISFAYKLYESTHGRIFNNYITLEPRETKTITSLQIVNPDPYPMNVQPLIIEKYRYKNLNIAGKSIYQSREIKCNEYYHKYVSWKLSQINKEKKDIYIPNNQNPKTTNKKRNSNSNSLTKKEDIDWRFEDKRIKNFESKPLQTNNNRFENNKKTIKLDKQLEPIKPIQQKIKNTLHKETKSANNHSNHVNRNNAYYKERDRLRNIQYQQQLEQQRKKKLEKQLKLEAESKAWKAEQERLARIRKKQIESKRIAEQQRVRQMEQFGRDVGNTVVGVVNLFKSNPEAKKRRLERRVKSMEMRKKRADKYRNELKKAMIDKEDDISSDGLILFKKKGLYGYKDINGKIIIKPKFLSAERFKNGKAKVRTKFGQHIIINTKGKKI
jgi:hypothetical protein